MTMPPTARLQKWTFFVSPTSQKAQFCSFATTETFPVRILTWPLRKQSWQWGIHSIPDGGSPPTMDTAKKERFPGRGPGRYRGTSSARAEHTAVVDLSGPSGTADDTTTSEAVARPALSREICNLTQKSQSDTCFFQNRRTVYQPDLFQGFSRLGLCSART